MSLIREAERAFFRGVRKWNQMYDRKTGARPTAILDVGEPETDTTILPSLPIELEDGKTGRKIHAAELEESDPLKAIIQTAEERDKSVKPAEKPVKVPQRQVVFVSEAVRNR